MTHLSGKQNVGLYDLIMNGLRAGSGSMSGQIIQHALYDRDILCREQFADLPRAQASYATNPVHTRVVGTRHAVSLRFLLSALNHYSGVCNQWATRLAFVSPGMQAIPGYGFDRCYVFS